MRILNKTHIQLESSAFAFSKKLLLPLLWLLIASCGGRGESDDPVQPAPPLGNDASLSMLQISGDGLDPAFSSSVTVYTTSVAVGTPSVDVNASTSDDNASVTINGGVATNVPLTVGKNTIVILVTAEDGTTTRSYTVVVARGSDNAHLSGLELPGATWDSPFDASQFNYALTVGWSAERVRIIPTADDADATIRVNEIAVVSGAASDPIELVEGSNIITVDVTSSDGSTSRAYTVAVTRKSALVVTQTVYVKASDPNFDHQFGARLAMSGNGSTLIVGSHFSYTRNARCASDEVYDFISSIYEHARDGGDFWVQLPKIREYTEWPESVGFPSGIALSADGSTLAVSGGWVGLRVFTRDSSGVWLQQELDISAAPDSSYSFRPVALSADGSTLAVGVTYYSGTLTGLHEAYVFTRDSGGVWVQQAELVVYDLGNRLLDLFEWSVALSGDGATLAVGGWGVYVFTRDSTDVWTEAAHLERFSPAPYWAGGIIGIDVALSRDGKTLAVGNGLGGSDTVDSVAVFARNSDGGWAGQAYIRPFTIDGRHSTADEFGKSVALSADGSILAVGKPSGPTGAAYIFTRDSGGGWAERAYVEPAIYPLELDGSISPIYFGIDVALSDDGMTLAVGGPFESSAGIGVNGDGANYGVCGSGAAYIFEIG